MISARQNLENLLQGYRTEAVTAVLDAYRAEVLAEAGQIAGAVIGPLWHTDTITEVQARLKTAGGVR